MGMQARWRQMTCPVQSCRLGIARTQKMQSEHGRGVVMGL